MTWTLRPWRMSDAGALAALLQDGWVLDMKMSARCRGENDPQRVL